MFVQLELQRQPHGGARPVDPDPFRERNSARTVMTSVPPHLKVSTQGLDPVWPRGEEVFQFGDLWPYTPPRSEQTAGATVDLQQPEENRQGPSGAPVYSVLSVCVCFHSRVESAAVRLSHCPTSSSVLQDHSDFYLLFHGRTLNRLSQIHKCDKRRRL